MPLDLENVQSGYNLAVINENFQRIEDSWDEKLDRVNSGSFYNQMEQELDMNSNHIINSPVPTEETHLVRLKELNDLVFNAEATGVLPLVQSRQVGDGVTTVFAAPNNNVVSAATMFISIDGVMQRPFTDYDVLAANQVTFTEAVPNLATVDITYFEPNIVENPDVSLRTVVSTGSTSGRTLADRFADVVNVKDFGAVGDGIADDTVALKAALATGKSVYLPEGTTYWVTSNLQLKSNTRVFSRGCKIITKDSWTDDTGDHYAKRRSVMYGENVENVLVKGIEINIDEIVGSESYATTPFMFRGCNDIEMVFCKGTHTATRTTNMNPFDLESTNNNIHIHKCYWQNETGASSGGAWVRNIATGTVTQSIWITDCEFVKDSGDEVLAVYGVLGATKDVYILNNKFTGTRDKAKHGTFISIFPLSSGVGAAINNVHFKGNTVVASGFNNEVIRVGNTGDESNQCNNVFVDDNYIFYNNETYTTSVNVVRFVENTGSFVSASNNKVEAAVGSAQVYSVFSGPWINVANNQIVTDAFSTFVACLKVENNFATNTNAFGQSFYNVPVLADNTLTSSRGGQVFNFELQTKILNNVFSITGTSYFLSSNELGTGKAVTFWCEGNIIDTTDVLSTVLQLDADVVENCSMIGNKFTGISPTEYHSGGANQFDSVDSNTWWTFTDEYASSTPYRSFGYNRMVPVGKFVYNNSIGASTGTQTFGWSKQEQNNNAADWSPIQVTVL